MEIVTINQARDLGLKRYYTGKPCKYGHLSEKLVSDRSCLECRKVTRASPEYLEKRREPHRLEVARWREANREKYNAYIRKWRSENSEHYLSWTRSWRLSDVDRTRVTAKKWRQANRGKIAHYTNLRKAAILQRTPAWADTYAILRIYKEARSMRDSGVNVHVDHIVPLKGRNVCGLHVEYNLRIIPAEENLLKRNFLIEELL